MNLIDKSERTDGTFSRSDFAFDKPLHVVPLPPSARFTDNGENRDPKIGHPSASVDALKNSASGSASNSGSSCLRRRLLCQLRGCVKVESGGAGMIVPPLF